MWSQSSGAAEQTQEAPAEHSKLEEWSPAGGMWVGTGSTEQAVCTVVQCIHMSEV